MRTRVVVVGLSSIVTATAFVGCNAILDNEPGVLVRTDEGGTEPDLPDVGPLPDVSSPDTGAPVLDGGDTGADVVTAPPPPPPPPPPTCPAGTKLCAGACVGIDDPAFGCGAATCDACALPHASATCRANQCALLACNAGFADCDAAVANGCEASLAAPTSCGACGNVCPPTAALCVPDGATHRCTSGCPPTAPVACGAECVDPSTSLAHCGGCNRPCPGVANGTSACVAGACTFTCGPGFQVCGTRCVSVDDPNACGPTCAVCPEVPKATRSCAAGACAFTCEAGRGNCDLAVDNGCEADLDKDALNCGACGIVCPTGRCRSGLCRLDD